MKKITLFLLLLSFNLSAQTTFLEYCELNGKTIAPSYSQSNCVQFLYKALVSYYPNLNDKDLKNEVYITNKENLETVIKQKSPIISGVCEALVKRGVAYYVDKPKAGDIFQYWILMSGWSPSGHCGVIKRVYGDGSFDMISSYNSETDNFTGRKADGYSVVHVDWSLDYVKFVRLK